MFTSEGVTHFFVFLLGFATVILTLSSAVSTFVLPRAARSQLNRIVFGLLRRFIDFILQFAKSYRRREFDDVLDQLAAAGVPLKTDREQA